MDNEQAIKLALIRVAEIDEQLNKSKMLYKERDALIIALMQLNWKEIKFAGKHFQLIDNFEDTNTCYRMAFIQRFSVLIREVKK